MSRSFRLVSHFKKICVSRIFLFSFHNQWSKRPDYQSVSALFDEEWGGLGVHCQWIWAIACRKYQSNEEEEQTTID